MHSHNNLSSFRATPASTMESQLSIYIADSSSIALPQVAVMHPQLLTYCLIRASTEPYLSMRLSLIVLISK